MKGLITLEEIEKKETHSVNEMVESYSVKYWTESDLQQIAPSSEVHKMQLISHFDRAEKAFDLVAQLLELYILLTRNRLPNGRIMEIFYNTNSSGKSVRQSGTLGSALSSINQIVDSPLLTRLPDVYFKTRDVYQKGYLEVEGVSDGTAYTNEILGVTRNEICSLLTGDNFLSNSGSSFVVTEMQVFYTIAKNNLGVLKTYDASLFVYADVYEKFRLLLLDEIKKIREFSVQIHSAKARLENIAPENTDSSIRAYQKSLLFEIYPQFSKDIDKLKMDGFLIEYPEGFIWTAEFGNLCFYFKCLAFEGKRNFDAKILEQSFLVSDSGNARKVTNIEIHNNCKQELKSFYRIRKLLNRDLYLAI